MMKPYLLIFRDLNYSENDIKQYLDTLSEILDWYAYFQNSIFIISESNSDILAEKICKKFKSLDFLITEIPMNNNQGMLTKDLWQFINNPEQQIEFKAKFIESSKDRSLTDDSKTDNDIVNDLKWFDIKSTLSELMKKFKNKANK